MAKARKKRKKASTKRKSARRRSSKRRRSSSKGHVPLKLLQRRAAKLNKIVASREKNPSRWK